MIQNSFCADYRSELVMESSSKRAKLYKISQSYLLFFGSETMEMLIQIESYWYRYAYFCLKFSLRNGSFACRIESQEDYSLNIESVRKNSKWPQQGRGEYPRNRKNSCRKMVLFFRAAYFAVILF